MNRTNETSVYSSDDGILELTSVFINLALGIPINGWVLWLVSSGAAGTTLASEIFVLNLSICELLYALLSILHDIDALYFYIFIYSFAEGFLFIGRPLFQTCMCVERLVAVVRPVLFLKCKPLRYRLACSAVAWLTIIGVSLIYALLLDPLDPTDDRTAYFIMGECLLFMSVMLLCSLAILKALTQAGPGETVAGRERDNALKKRALTIICLTLVLFVGTYGAWCIALLISGLETQKLAVDICYSITMVSGIVQPLLYICQKTGKLPCYQPMQGS